MTGKLLQDLYADGDKQDNRVIYGRNAGAGAIIQEFEDDAAAVNDKPAWGTIGESLARVVTILETVPECESSIEIQLGVEIKTHLNTLLSQCKVEIVPQYKWQRFRIDWALVKDDKPLLFIECDGKEFHSSPEQLERDREKDKVANEAGIKMLRFTGSEIHQNVKACVNRVCETLIFDCGVVL